MKSTEEWKGAGMRKKEVDQIVSHLMVLSKEAGMVYTKIQCFLEIEEYGRMTQKQYSKDQKERIFYRYRYLMQQE